MSFSSLRHVEAGFLGAAIARALSAWPRRSEQLLVEVEILLAAGILHAHGDRDLGRFDRTWPSTGNSFSTTFSLDRLSSVEHVGHRAFAVAAIVVEELDEGDIAVLVAERTPRGELKIALRILGDAGLDAFRPRRPSGACSARPSPLPALRDAPADNS
jgi:hypothetical protein